MEIAAVFNITKDLLAFLGKDIVQHVAWNIYLSLVVLIVLLVAQLEKKKHIVT